MRVSFTLSGLEGIEAKVRKVFDSIRQQLISLTRILNGNLTFGDGTLIDNIAGQWMTFTASGSEDALSHNLGVIPVGFLVVIPPTSGTVNRGSTPWTTSHLYVKATASEVITIFVLAPPSST